VVQRHQKYLHVVKSQGSELFTQDFFLYIPRPSESNMSVCQCHMLHTYGFWTHHDEYGGYQF